MRSREAFQSELETLCENEGWELTPGQVEIKFETGLGGDHDEGPARHQCVLIQDLDFEGDRLVRFFAVIGDTRRIDSRRLNQALRINFGLPFGAMAIRDDDLVIVDTLRLDDADSDSTRAVLRYLAETADHFEKTLFGVDEH